MRQIEDRMREDADEESRKDYTEGIESVLYIRCMEHRAVPAYNQAEGHGECACCAIEKLKEQHSREIAVMAKDAFSEAFLSLVSQVKSAGYCSFCDEVLVANSLEEAKRKQRAHLLRCSELRKAIDQGAKL